MERKTALRTDCEWIARRHAGDRQLNQATIEHAGATEHEIDSVRGHREPASDEQ